MFQNRITVFETSRHEIQLNPITKLEFVIAHETFCLSCKDKTVDVVYKNNCFLMRSSNVTHIQSVDEGEIFFVSVHAVGTVTNKIQNFKEAKGKNTHV
jgi:hypothetical protein